ncbi:hypothetical protein FD755_006779 [Muntiacus reevesi]|uniref:Ciliary associated calcium binding coiled-coil 1 n=1 Tax=Muntiacus reevesi TaxID=9886 RepID=A0A5J5MZK5_MUNRE|nr:hypothetical protein FD755_006779 [Muntiacus reevesi]
MSTFQSTQMDTSLTCFFISTVDHPSPFSDWHYLATELLNYFCLTLHIFLSYSQLIEVVNPADYPFPDPLEEGISFDIYSKFIEPPPPLDMEIKGLNQEQGPEESQPEADTSETDLLVGFTIEEIKSVLDQVTDDILISIQELNVTSPHNCQLSHLRLSKIAK